MPSNLSDILTAYHFHNIMEAEKPCANVMTPDVALLLHVADQGQLLALGQFVSFLPLEMPFHVMNAGLPMFENL